MELRLRRTWHEISEVIEGGSPNPLRIAELINRVQPCNWIFEFTFDAHGRTTVEIDCEATVSDSTVRGIFDGTLEELLFSDMINLRQNGEFKSGDTASLLSCPPDSNLMLLQENKGSRREKCQLCALEGFWQATSIPSEIQKSQAVRDYFLEHTWLGSPKYIGSGHSVRWVVFGTTQVIHPGSRYVRRLGDYSSYCTQVDLYRENGRHLGQAIFQTSPTLKRDEFFTTFGPANVSPAGHSTSRTRSEPFWLVEMGSPALKNAVHKREPTTSLVTQLIDSLEEARTSIGNQTCFQAYMENTSWRQQANTASKLKRRQEQARTRDCVIFQNKAVMLVPSNENEVLVLLCKLEGLQALPFSEFCLWEYTSREGIDAIATYQVKEVDVTKQFSSVEVEHLFENFLDHNHPHQQVDLVVCWDFRSDDLPSNLHQRCEWLYEYRNDDIFQVAVLSRIPDLYVKRK